MAETLTPGKGSPGALCRRQKFFERPFLRAESYLRQTRRGKVTHVTRVIPRALSSTNLFGLEGHHNDFTVYPGLIGADIEESDNQALDTGLLFQLPQRRFFDAFPALGKTYGEAPHALRGLLAPLDKKKLTFSVRKDYGNHGKRIFIVNLAACVAELPLPAIDDALAQPIAAEITEYLLFHAPDTLAQSPFYETPALEAPPPVV